LRHFVGGGHALFPPGLGEFTVVVAARGYAEAQKHVDITGRARVDVYLRPVSGPQSLATVPGKPLLAPQAKQALDKGLRASKENKLADADKFWAKPCVSPPPGIPKFYTLKA
jgi:hypothetical protein